VLVRDTRRTRVILAALLTLARAARRQHLRGSAQMRTTSARVFGTAARAVQSVTSPMAGLLQRGSTSAGSSLSASALRAKLIKLRAELNNGQLSRRDQARLATLLQLPGRSGHSIIGADVIAADRGSSQTITLDVGRLAGVTPDTTVLNSSGLVGRVTSVSRWTCMSGWQLPERPWWAFALRQRPDGLVTGMGDTGGSPDLLRLHVVGASKSVVPGQRLVTFASVGDRPYVRGVPVGVVTRVETGAGSAEMAQVRPFADFAALGVVGVLRPGGRP
jgi:rod shape-determining protein MreC